VPPSFFVYSITKQSKQRQNRLLYAAAFSDWMLPSAFAALPCVKRNQPAAVGAGVRRQLLLKKRIHTVPPGDLCDFQQQNAVVLPISFFQRFNALAGKFVAFKAVLETLFKRAELDAAGFAVRTGRRPAA
jgi:hypothetical protein